MTDWYHAYLLGSIRADTTSTSERMSFGLAAIGEMRK